VTATGAAIAATAVAAIATGVGVVACGSEEVAPAPTSCTGVELVVAASDLSSSVVCGAPGCERSERTTGAGLGRDPALSTSRGRAFFLARTEASIFELDPTCGTPFAIYDIDEGLPGIPNPHDVAVASDGSLFVALYNRPKILILSPAGKPTGAIDLSSYDEKDGNPEAEAIHIADVGGKAKAFVALERLDAPELLSSRPSQMLRIDVESRAVEAVIQLEGRNPFNTMPELDGALFMAEPGRFDRVDEPMAGIERFEIATSTTRLLVKESALGGSVAEVAVAPGCGVAIVASPIVNLNPTSVVTFDPATGEVFASAAAPLLGPTPQFDLRGLAWRGDRLYVGDRRAGGRGYPVHVFERDRSPGAGACALRAVGPTIDLPSPPIALRPAR